MTQIQHSLNRKNAADALRSFARRFELQASTEVTFDECPGSIALGLVRNFGSPNGVLIDAIGPPSYEGDLSLKKYADDREIYYSQVNAAQLATYGDTDFIEMFRDWGYYGKSPPLWLAVPEA